MESPNAAAFSAALFGQASEAGDVEEMTRIWLGYDGKPRDLLTWTDEKRGRNALHRACNSGKHAAVRQLLEWGAPVEQESREGRRALHYACAAVRHHIVELLLETANANAKTRDGKTPIYLACCMYLAKAKDLPYGEDRYETWERTEIILRRLLQKKANIDELVNGKTALHLAVLNDDEALARHLVCLGASVEVRNSRGKTPLDDLPLDVAQLLVKLHESEGGNALYDEIDSTDESESAAGGSASASRKKYEEEDAYGIPLERFHPDATAVRGVGGFGEVIQASLTCVAKQLKRPGVVDDRKKFDAEIERVKMLAHKNIVRVYGVVRDGNHTFLVMEACTTSLKKRLYDEPTKPDRLEILYLLLGIAEGLEYLHDTAKIIHRDVKPENVLLMNGMPKLCDFGLARCRTIASDYHSCLGTHRYVAPAVLIGHYTRQCDVFSFGMVMWELFERRRPFSEVKDDREADQKIVNGERPTFSNLTPENYRSFIRDCWDAGNYDPNPDPEKPKLGFKKIVAVLRSWFEDEQRRHGAAMRRS